ncbi:T9SS type A sorting domain-containing protein, partial [bacterium]|nr:T9SS type A sorting domain-containing protein [bacterium]
VFFYNTSGVADSGMVKVFTVTDADPLTPVTMLFEGYEVVPGGDYSAHALPIEGAVDLMAPISVEVTWPNAAGTGKLLMDSEAIFDGDICYYTADQGAPEDGWYGSGNGHHIYAAVSYAGDTAVNDSPVVAPLSFQLFNNYPNPFNPATSIKFAIPSAEFVSVKVFNVNGQEVATLVNGELTAGYHSFTWDASNVSSGVYLYQIIAGEYSATHKMLLTK